MPGLSNSYPVYAPVEDLNLYLGSEPEDGEALIERASAIVRSVTRTAFYATDPLDGYSPTAEYVKNAFHDATVIQAGAYVEAGIGARELVASGSGPKEIVSKSLGGRSVTYGTNSSAVRAREALLGGAMSPEAFSVLSSAGLTTSQVTVGFRTPFFRAGLSGSPVTVIDGGTP
jgi:hypothetical protein